MRVLIVSASAGAGHTQAARALEEACGHHSPALEVKHVDILDFTAATYKKAYASGYLEMVNRAPALWGYLYQTSDHIKERRVQDRFVRFFDKIEFAHFRAFVREYNPDLVLTTHFLPCQVFAPYRAKGRDLFPLAVILTDFDAHAFWVQPTADRFFVASAEVKAVLVGRGILEDKIAITGIPIKEAFTRQYDRNSLCTKYGLSPSLPIVLVTSGGAGVGTFEETLRVALESGPVQVIAVAGRNEALRKRLSALQVPVGSRLIVFGFVDTMPELMAMADLAVAKSGGLTTSECLAMGLPMVVRDPIPGQEERNADYLLEVGAGVKAHGAASLGYKLKELLHDQKRCQKMRQAALTVAQPMAAARIVTEALAVGKPSR